MSKYDEWVARKEGFFKLSLSSNTTGAWNPEVKDLFELKGYLEGFVTELFEFFLEGFSEFFDRNKKGAIRLISFHGVSTGICVTENPAPGIF